MTKIFTEWYFAESKAREIWGIFFNFKKYWNGKRWQMAAVIFKTFSIENFMNSLIFNLKKYNEKLVNPWNLIIRIEIIRNLWNTNYPKSQLLIIISFKLLLTIIYISTSMDIKNLHFLPVSPQASSFSARRKNRLTFCYDRRSIDASVFVDDVYVCLHKTQDQLTWFL